MIKAGILIISDRASCGQRQDLCGPLLKEMLGELGAEILTCEVIPDEANLITERLKDLTDRLGCDLILTSGGTGLGPRDVTPEATRSVIEREVSGLSEAMRILSFSKSPFSLISRGICGTRGRTLIINLPGSPKGVKECLEVILKTIPHAISILRGDSHQD